MNELLPPRTENHHFTGPNSNLAKLLAMLSSQVSLEHQTVNTSLEDTLNDGLN
jgi:hypothetical protein